MHSEVKKLLSAEAVRNSARKMLAFAQAGGSHFELHLEKLPAVAERVVVETKQNYPSLQIPFHARWRHFEAGGVDRIQAEQHRFPTDRWERCRCKIDFVIPSVLLDAGAGMQWSYLEKKSGNRFSRSEGLGLASLELFFSGKFHSKGEISADSRGLLNIESSDIEKYFQVSKENPLIGVDGRAGLLKRLGEVLSNRTRFPFGRPSDVLHGLVDASTKQVSLPQILSAILTGLGEIWPGRISLHGMNLGDVWKHSRLSDSADDLVVIHKLSQWLSYSLVEPLLEAGVEVTELDGLTGLAEYRNGGLFIDMGVLSLRDSNLAALKHHVGDDLIIEWRALTVALLDELLPQVRERLGQSEASFPLVKMLEGGSWWAGRRLAAEKRKDGGSPLLVISDGTVF